MMHPPFEDLSAIDPVFYEGLKAAFDRGVDDFACVTTGARFADVRSGAGRMTLDHSKKVQQPAGLMHGGAIMTLCDATTALAILSVQGPGAQFVTLNMNTQFLRPVSGGTATCEARIVRAGSRTIYLEAWVRDSGGRDCAHCTCTYFVLKQGKLAEARAAAQS